LRRHPAVTAALTLTFTAPGLAAGTCVAGRTLLCLKNHTFSLFKRGFGISLCFQWVFL